MSSSQQNEDQPPQQPPPAATWLTQLVNSSRGQPSIFSVGPPARQPTDRTPNTMLQLECQSWNRDSHELYDYESQNYYIKKFLVENSVRVFRNHIEVFWRNEDCELPLVGDFLLSVKLRDNKFWVYPADKLPGPNAAPPSASSALSSRKLWLITRFLKDQRYALTEGDVIKLGRFKLRIKQIVAQTASEMDGGPPPVVDFRLDGPDVPITELTRDQAATTQCRICLLEGAEDNDPLIRACQCKGSIMYVHLDCLRHWVNGRLNLTDDPNRTCCFIRQIPCELCKATFPSSVSFNGVKMPIVKVPKIEPPFIVLENLVGAGNRGVHLCSLAAKKECKLGRGHESDVRIADVSISRWHATIKFADGQFQLQDQRSKFGTLVALKREVLVEDTLSVQVGRTVIKFSLVNPSGSAAPPAEGTVEAASGWSTTTEMVDGGAPAPAPATTGENQQQQGCATAGNYVPIRRNDEATSRPFRVDHQTNGQPPVGIFRSSDLPGLADVSMETPINRRGEDAAPP